MGTNYFWESDACGACGHVAERRHICKSYTSFYSGVVAPPDDDFSSFGTVEFSSWDEWRDWLRDAGGRIVDEYGHVHDVEAFIGAVESTSMEARSWQTNWIARHETRFSRVVPWPLDTREVGLDDRRAWLDPDGFSFTDDSFS